MGLVTLLGIIGCLTFAYITIYNIQNKNYNNIKIYHGRIEIEEFDIHTFINRSRLIVQVNVPNTKPKV